MNEETRAERMAGLRERIREILERPPAVEMISPTPPRYDEVYFAGLKWLDDEDGGPLLPSSEEKEEPCGKE